MGTKNNPGDYDYYQRADPDEPMFVLLGRDPSASLLVRMWLTLRAETTEAAKLSEAQECARALEAWCRSLGKEPLTPERIKYLRDAEQHARLLHFAKVCANQSKESGTRIAALFAIDGQLGTIVDEMRRGSTERL